MQEQLIIDSVEDAPEAKVELFARFLAFLAQKLDSEPSSTSPRLSVLLSVLKHFTTTYLSEQDIHNVTASYQPDVRKVVLTSYYAALAKLEAKNVSDIPRGPPSALLNAASNNDASVYALFGGQGTNEVYFDELQALYDTYKPYVEPFIATVTRESFIPLADENEETNYYTQGLDVLSWLSGVVARPSVAYLASIPISFPLIGLTQLVQYLVTAKIAQLSPGELRALFAGTTGHSQGLGSAICVAVSDSFDSFTANTIRLMKWMFYSGLRGQQYFPVLALEPSIIQDCVEGGEGTPSPMLSVTGLSQKDLEAHIKKTNSHLEDNSKLQISLVNGSKAFVVTGPARALYGLVTSLRKVRAPSGVDQSKTPYSQRKPVFSVRFLVVNVPYHSTYLKGATEEMFEDDLETEELWSPKDLAIPVFHTENGAHTLFFYTFHVF